MKKLLLALGLVVAALLAAEDWPRYIEPIPLLRNWPVESWLSERDDAYRRAYASGYRSGLVAARQWMRNPTTPSTLDQVINRDDKRLEEELSMTHQDAINAGWWMSSFFYVYGTK